MCVYRIIIDDSHTDGETVFSAQIPSSRPTPTPLTIYQDALDQLCSTASGPGSTPGRDRVKSVPPFRVSQHFRTTDSAPVSVCFCLPTVVSASLAFHAKILPEVRTSTIPRPPFRHSSVATGSMETSIRRIRSNTDLVKLQNSCASF